MYSFFLGAPEDVLPQCLQAAGFEMKSTLLPDEPKKGLSRSGQSFFLTECCKRLLSESFLAGEKDLGVFGPEWVVVVHAGAFIKNDHPVPKGYGRVIQLVGRIQDELEQNPFGRREEPRLRAEFFSGNDRT
jgi:hypothetical protein